jgi:hypothetical protein
MISSLNIINLPVIAVVVLNPSAPSTNAPALAGFGCTVTNTGAGTWRVDLPQGFPLGSYVAAGVPNAGSADVTISLTDGDATTKFINTRVGGASSSTGAFVIYYALPTQPLTFS